MRTVISLFKTTRYPNCIVYMCGRLGHWSLVPARTFLSRYSLCDVKLQLLHCTELVSFPCHSRVWLVVLVVGPLLTLSTIVFWTLGGILYGGLCLALWDSSFHFTSHSYLFYLCVWFYLFILRVFGLYSYTSSNLMLGKYSYYSNIICSDSIPNCTCDTYLRYLILSGCYDGTNSSYFS